MLEVTIPEMELYNEKTSEFFTINETTIQLEHSLISISKWESKWKKPFLSKEPKTTEQVIDYIKCMTLTQNVNPIIYKNLTRDVTEKISEYIEDPMTATWFSNEEKKSGSKKVITSELIYYWMVVSNIPFECQKWHLNRLLTLIRICSVEGSQKKKMPKSEIYARNRALNEARRKMGHHKG